MSKPEPNSDALAYSVTYGVFSRGILAIGTLSVFLNLTGLLLPAVLGLGVLIGFVAPFFLGIRKREVAVKVAYREVPAAPLSDETVAYSEAACVSAQGLEAPEPVVYEDKGLRHTSNERIGKWIPPVAPLPLTIPTTDAKGRPRLVDRPLPSDGCPRQGMGAATLDNVVRHEETN